MPLGKSKKIIKSLDLNDVNQVGVFVLMLILGRYYNNIRNKALFSFRPANKLVLKKM
jgi:hypothetical protein